MDVDQLRSNHVAYFLIARATGLQVFHRRKSGHMMWLQRQDSFKHDFGKLKPDSDAVEAADRQYSRNKIEFRRLSILFGPEHAKAENSNTVILISDSSGPVSQQENEDRLKEIASEEVTSPVADQSRKMRRKLFEEGAQPKDLETTNDKGHYFYTVGPDGEMKFQLPNVYPPRPAKHEPKPLSSSHASSCASSSPSMWWTNPFK